MAGMRRKRICLQHKSRPTSDPSVALLLSCVVTEGERGAAFVFTRSRRHSLYDCPLLAAITVREETPSRVSVEQGS